MSWAAVGIDIGGTRTKAVRVVDRQVVDRTVHPTPDSVDSIVDLAGDLAGDLGAGDPVGVGVAGLVDHARGVLVWAPHLPGVEVEVRSRLMDRLGVGVLVDNDANMAALAENEESRAGTTLALSLGTGIGMGLVTNGSVYRGRAHAGEVGHTKAESCGDPCSCGRQGCWETLVSGNRLDQEAASILGVPNTAADLVAAARDGHTRAAGAVAEAAAWLAWGLETLALAFDPDEIVIGGGVAAAGDILLDPVRQRLAVLAERHRRPDIPVRASKLGSYAAAIGAARATASA